MQQSVKFAARKAVQCGLRRSRPIRRQAPPLHIHVAQCSTMKQRSRLHVSSRQWTTLIRRRTRTYFVDLAIRYVLNAYLLPYIA